MIKIKDSKNKLSRHVFTEEEISFVIKTELPEWEKGCDDISIQGMLMHSGAFGYSTSELLLSALAIKYATGKGKEVRIIPKQKETK